MEAVLEVTEMITKTIAKAEYDIAPKAPVHHANGAGQACDGMGRRGVFGCLIRSEEVVPYAPKRLSE